jgi:hypothetical protein
VLAKAVVLANPPGRSRGTGMPLAATLSLAVRVAFDRALSAATTTAERPGAIPPAGVPVSEEALAAAVAFMAVVDTPVVAGGGNHRFDMLRVEREV